MGSCNSKHGQLQTIAVSKHKNGKLLRNRCTPTPGSTSSNETHGSEGKNPEPPTSGMVKVQSILGLDELSERSKHGPSGINLVHFELAPYGKPIEEVYDGVHSGKELGQGITGLVRLVTHRATGVQYALKKIEVSKVNTPEGLKQLKEEIYIMCLLDHPNIVRLEEVYETQSEIFLVQELLEGGELFDRLTDQPGGYYPEDEGARLVKSMLNAVRYLHSKGIVHRDLKLENFLFASKAPDAEVKLIDFGLSKFFSAGHLESACVGTLYTVAPEVLRGSYDERADMWSIGVLAYLLLCGYSPFGGDDGGCRTTVSVKILKGEYSLEDESESEHVWADVSLGAKEFIRSLLVTDPSLRPRAQEAQKHAWLQLGGNSVHGEPSDLSLNPNIVQALISFKDLSDLKKLLSEVLSFMLLPQQIKHLHKEFEKLDTDGTGEISLAALKQVLMTGAGNGGLTEQQAEDVCNAIHVKKSDNSIHWHEFIAAALSQCPVDDRNLRLAFDRLDNAHKGYVTLGDLRDLVGDHLSEEALEKMWSEGMKQADCPMSLFTYADFVLLMTGPGQRGHLILDTLETDPDVPSF